MQISTPLNTRNVKDYRLLHSAVGHLYFFKYESLTKSSTPVSHFQPSSTDESQEEECDQTGNQKDLLLSHFGQFPWVKKVYLISQV